MPTSACALSAQFDSTRADRALGCVNDWFSRQIGRGSKLAQDFQDQIAKGLGVELSPQVSIEDDDAAELGGWFNVSALAVASFGAAATETAALLGKSSVTISRKRLLKWFGTTLRPKGWELPAVWDSIAGDYVAADGWIRLHTNAPHHRIAALDVLGCEGSRDAVSQAVRQWNKADLESSIIAEGGCAAAMHTLDEWSDHPQGRAVVGEPLIAWQDTGVRGKPLGLESLRVLDLTRVLAGPVATRFLAGFGANVLRIDPPDWNEPAVEPEMTLGKRCAGLDLKTKHDRGIFEGLVEHADILVHGYRPGALEGLGYPLDRLRALAPELIDVGLNAYGHRGPWADRRGFDSLVQMSCGISAGGMLRSQCGRPFPLPVQALDHATGYLMAAAILRALRLRQQDGRTMSARVSLARTAALLISGGVAKTALHMPAETDADFAPEVEHTGWGEARRIAFPASIDGVKPRWRYPSGPLRMASARW